MITFREMNNWHLQVQVGTEISRLKVRTQKLVFINLLKPCEPDILSLKHSSTDANPSFFFERERISKHEADKPTRSQIIGRIEI